MIRTFEPRHFESFLETGVSLPAKARFEDGHWVIRYPGSAGRNRRLASDLVGLRLAALLKVQTPAVELVSIPESFTPSGTDRPIGCGFGNACRWIEGARYPSINDPLTVEPFWRQEQYVSVAASIIILDTWVMNADRRKLGNVILQGEAEKPEVFFPDFDRAFFAQYKDATGAIRHWCEPAFPTVEIEQYLPFSVFGCPHVCDPLDVRSAGRSTLDRLTEVTEQQIRGILAEVPESWGVPATGLALWGNRLVARRDLLIRKIRISP